jgi:dephospho-CoA kinase
MKIIGIGGTDGAGKDSLGHYLRDEHGWCFISVTNLLREEATKRNLPLSRSNLRLISAEWRAKDGLGVLVDKAVDDYKKMDKPYTGLVMASLRNPGEADSIHEHGGQLVWVDAPIELRHQRAVARNKGTEDQVTFEEFRAEEQAQMDHSGDKTTLNLSGVKAKADIFITNDSNDIEDFKKAAQAALRQAGII